MASMSSSHVYWSCNFSNTNTDDIAFVSAPSSPASLPQNDGEASSTTPSQQHSPSLSPSPSPYKQNTYSIDRASLSPDGKRLAVMTEEALHLFHIVTGESHELEAPSYSSCILWASHENLMIGMYVEVKL